MEGINTAQNSVSSILLRKISAGKVITMDISKALGNLQHQGQ